MSNLKPFTPNQPYELILQDGTQYTIPATQAESPSTQPEIAFRPACLQLQSVVEAEGTTAFVWESLVMTRYEGVWDIKASQTQLYLDSEGICKLNGAVVPLFPSNALPQASVVEATIVDSGLAQGATAVTGPASVLGANTGWGLIIAGAVLLLGSIGGIALLFARYRNNPPQQDSEKSLFINRSILLSHLNERDS